MIKNKKSKKLPLILLIVSTVIVLAAGVFVLFKKDSLLSVRSSETITNDRPQDPENDINYDPPTEQEKAEAEQQKEEIINNAENPPTPSATISATIIRAEQREKGGPLSVRALVNGTTTGTCTISLYRMNSETIVKKFPVVFEATTSSCGVIDIPADEIDKGMWNLSLVVESGSLKSQPQTTQIGINK